MDWPIADFGSEKLLKTHLEHVAGFSMMLAPRLDAVKVFWDALGARPSTVLVLASALHDIGKASRFYKDRGNFALHEHVSAIVIFEASRQCGGVSKPSGRILALASMATARHHAANRDRRARDIARSRAGEVAEAIQHLEAEDLRKALEWAPRSLTQLIELGLEKAKGLAFNKAAITDILYLIGGLGPLRILCEGQIPGCVRLLWAVTGYLIVSDILVAAAERRNEQEETNQLKPYAKYWIRELNLDSNDVSQAIIRVAGGNASLARERIEEALNECT